MDQRLSEPRATLIEAWSSLWHGLSNVIYVYVAHADIFEHRHHTSYTSPGLSNLPDYLSWLRIHLTNQFDGMAVKLANLTRLP